MLNEPNESDLERIPRFNTNYPRDGNGELRTVIYEHFFLPGNNWYVAEYEPKERLFLGYKILNDDFRNARWEKFSFDELRKFEMNGNEVDRDLDWTPRPAWQIEKIKLGVKYKLYLRMVMDKIERDKRGRD